MCRASLVLVARRRVREYLEEFAEKKSPPDEWCYVHNFDDAYMPKAIRLPRSRGVAFKTSMAAMVADARERIPLTFQSEDFVKRRDEIVRSVQRRHEAVFSELADKTRAQGFLLQSSPAGFFLVPMAGDQPIDDQTFAALPAEERERLLQTRDQLMEALRVRYPAGRELRENCPRKSRRAGTEHGDVNCRRPTA